jgi:SAM-dependent methyltransferase
MSDTRTSDAWDHGSPYERFMGRWSRGVAPEFLAWLDLPGSGRWVDVGCGTGALTAAIADTCAPASLVGIEPSPGFLASARRNLGSRAALHEGSATSIPLADASVDAVVSGLVLNFVPDVAAALVEASRVVVPGGTVAAYVWDYAGRMDFLRHFWDAAVAADPAAVALDEGVRFPLCDGRALAKAFGDAGLVGVRTTTLDVATEFAGFEAYWAPFLGAQGPAPAYLMSLAEEARSRLRGHLERRLPREPDGSIRLVARAWSVRGASAGQDGDRA